MKTCTGCKIEKPLSEFVKNKNAKDGLNHRCRKCVSEYMQINRDRNIANNKLWRQKNKEKQKEYFKIYRQNNKEYLKNYSYKNKEKISEYKKIWNLLNKEKNQKYKTEYREKNRERLRDYEKTKRRSDPIYKLKTNLRGRTWSAFKRKRWNKNSKTQEILGADYQTVYNHIESMFKKGMSWNNYGEWHIDHIIPLSSAKTKGELIQICHYTNLQPLWAKENQTKGSKIINCKL